nr:hypothetical protein [Tanacetum cinerariifolium]
MAVRAEGNAAGHNRNQIRCYNCRGAGHFARDWTVRLRRRDATYLQTQLLIAQKEDAGIQLQVEEYDLMAAAADLKEIEEQVPQNDNNVISKVTDVEQGGETVEQHLANFEETHALYDSLYQNLAVEVEKVNSVNRKLKETNADLTTELARYKNQERCFEISQEKYDKLESQDIIYVVQNASVIDTSNLQTELERTKERFENYIIKKKNEYVKLWNDWYKKCDECKYHKISYAKAYKDMQQKIERLQPQLGDLKGKSKDTSCVSNTLNPLFQKLENANVELEFQLFKKVSDQKDNTQDLSANTKFANQPIVENLPKIGKTNALTKPVTSNSVSTPQVSKGLNNAKVIALGMFRISPDKSSRNKNKEAEVEEHHRNLLLSKKNKQISSACNNSKIDSQDVISKVVCA